MQLERKYISDEQRCIQALLLLLEMTARRDNHAAARDCEPGRRRGELEVRRDEQRPRA